MTVTPSDLWRKLSKHIDAGRGTRLSAEELDLLVTTGAIDALSKAAVEFQRQMAEERRHAKAEAASDTASQLAQSMTRRRR